MMKHGFAGAALLLGVSCAPTVVQDDWLTVRADELSRDRPGYPRLADVPQAPEDKRTPEEWAAARADLDRINAELDELAARKRAEAEELD